MRKEDVRKLNEAIDIMAGLAREYDRDIERVKGSLELVQADLTGIINKANEVFEIAEQFEANYFLKRLANLEARLTQLERKIRGR